MVELPPRDVLEAARRAGDMRVSNSLVADISYDSLLDGDRAESPERRLRFSAEDLEVDVVVRASGTRLQLLVELRPRAEATVRTFDSIEGHEVPPSGAVTLLVEPGLTSLVVERSAPGTRVVQTAWVAL